MKLMTQSTFMCLSLELRLLSSATIMSIIGDLDPNNKAIKCKRWSLQAQLRRDVLKVAAQQRDIDLNTLEKTNIVK